jgi:hypothetical protein
MYHLAAYNSSIANGSVLLQVTNVADIILATSNKGFFVKDTLPNLAYLFTVGTNLTRFQLSSGSIRKMFPWDFDRVNVGTVLENPVRMHDFTASPIALKQNEELDAYCVQSNAGAQQEYIFACFSDGPLRRVSGHIQTMHATGTTTLTANGWTQVPLTLDNGLDGATYALVGLGAFSAGALAARVVPRGNSAYRPGVPAAQARNQSPPAPWRYGEWGEMVRFPNTAVPQIEFFSVSADTAEECYLDVIEIA